MTILGFALLIWCKAMLLLLEQKFGGGGKRVNRMVGKRLLVGAFSVILMEKTNPGCDKSAQSSTSFCVKYGGVKCALKVDLKRWLGVERSSALTVEESDTNWWDATVSQSGKSSYVWCMEEEHYYAGTMVEICR